VKLFYKKEINTFTKRFIMAAGDIIEFTNMSLNAAVNGWIIEFTEKKEPMSRGDFDNLEFMHKEIVFTDDETEEAFDKFKEMHMFNKIKKGGQKVSPPLLKMAAVREST